MHQGLEQDVVQNPGCTNAAKTSTKTQDQRPSLEHKGSLAGFPGRPLTSSQGYADLPARIPYPAGDLTLKSA
jgi:hypothetical protein